MEQHIKFCPLCHMKLLYNISWLGLCGLLWMNPLHYFLSLYIPLFLHGKEQYIFCWNQKSLEQGTTQVWGNKILHCVMTCHIIYCFLKCLHFLLTEYITDISSDHRRSTKNVWRAKSPSFGQSTPRSTDRGEAVTREGLSELKLQTLLLQCPVNQRLLFFPFYTRRSLLTQKCASDLCPANWDVL